MLSAEKNHLVHFTFNGTAPSNTVEVFRANSQKPKQIVITRLTFRGAANFPECSWFTLHVMGNQSSGASDEYAYFDNSLNMRFLDNSTKESMRRFDLYGSNGFKRLLDCVDHIPRPIFDDIKNAAFKQEELEYREFHEDEHGVVVSVEEMTVFASIIRQRLTDCKNMMSPFKVWMTARTSPELATSSPRYALVDIAYKEYECGDNL